MLNGLSPVEYHTLHGQTLLLVFESEHSEMFFLLIFGRYIRYLLAIKHHQRKLGCNCLLRADALDEVGAVDCMGHLEAVGGWDLIFEQEGVVVRLSLDG